jgi:hypothetical protein
MKSYAAIEIFSEDELNLLGLAERIVEGLPDEHDGELLRCHEVARIVARRLDRRDLTVIDGKYGPVEHTWIHLARAKRGTPLILDAYCVGRLPQVQLVHTPYDLGAHYKPGPTRRDLRFEVIEAYSEGKPAARGPECSGTGGMHLWQDSRRNTIVACRACGKLL